MQYNMCELYFSFFHNYFSWFVILYQIGRIWIRTSHNKIGSHWLHCICKTDFHWTIMCILSFSPHGLHKQWQRWLSFTFKLSASSNKDDGRWLYFGAHYFEVSEPLFLQIQLFPHLSRRLMIQSVSICSPIYINSRNFQKKLKNWPTPNFLYMSHD